MFAVCCPTGSKRSVDRVYFGQAFGVPKRLARKGIEY